MGKYVIPECEYCYLKRIEIVKHFNEDGSSLVSIVCTYDLKDKDKHPLPHMNTVTKAVKVMEKSEFVSDSDLKNGWAEIFDEVETLTKAAKLEYAGYTKE